jgi:hypothetical protein
VADAAGGLRGIARSCSGSLSTFPDLSRVPIGVRKLVQEGLYTSATFLASPRTANADGAYDHLNDLTSLRTFVTAFAGHIASVAALYDGRSK